MEIHSLKTPEEAGRILGLSAQALRQWARSGYIPSEYAGQPVFTALRPPYSRRVQVRFNISAFLDWMKDETKRVVQHPVRRKQFDVAEIKRVVRRVV